jgi:hypothetical protein
LRAGHKAMRLSGTSRRGCKVGGRGGFGGSGGGGDGDAAGSPADAAGASEDDVEPMALKTRQSILAEVLEDETHEYYAFAKYLTETYVLTDRTDRQSSKDYIRLCTLKDDFHRECADDRDKLKIYKVKSFFSNVLKLEVTGEWDRHGHGGIRGPWVYGLRAASGPPTPGPGP